MRAAGDTTEEAKRPPALFVREGRAQERHCKWHDQGRADALEGTCGNQPANAARQCTGA
jgi:hypothetical protein